MLDILNYNFFQNALIWWILVSLISSFLWLFIIMRKEANITHSISNFLFLWIAVSFLLNWNYYIYAFLFWIIASLFIFFIEKTKFITKESSKEIISQAWIAWWLFLLGFLNNLTLDINSLFFWNILFINNFDLVILLILLILISVFFLLFWRNFLIIILNEDIARSRWISVWLYNYFFLLILSIFIALSLKIFWIMLIGAFLVIPTNISKIISNNLKKVLIFSVLISLFSTIFWIFISYYLWTWTGASIILTMILIFILTIILKRS